jgi:cytochrome c553
MLPSGFQALNVGNGALCITCHNSRNGKKSDAVTLTSFSAPHTASQGDVLMGENAFFVQTPVRSPHAAIKNTCAACHMEASPPPAEFSYQGAGTNHSFKASPAICSQCHSAQLDAKAFQVGEEVKIARLATAMNTYLLSKVGTSFVIQDYTPHQFSGKEYDVRSNTITILKDNIASMEPTEPHGQQGFLFKFKTPVTFTYAPAGETPHTMTVTTAEVQLGNITTDGTKTVVAFTDVLVKAGWNYFLLHGDGSGGIHNPAFAEEVIDATLNALK